MAISEDAGTVSDKCEYPFVIQTSYLKSKYWLYSLWDGEWGKDVCFQYSDIVLEFLACAIR